MIWKTDIELQNHREVGGYIITDYETKIAEYQYILDGQQRTTSLLTSLYGIKHQIDKSEDPTIYFNLTINNSPDIDDEIYKKRFLFWSDIDDNNGNIKRNVKNKENFDNGLIIKLSHLKHNYHEILENLMEKGYKYKSIIRK